jgi:hypothetical protein
MLSRSYRWAWRWCLIYPAVVAPELRRRRREEVRSHLWESGQASLPGRAVLRATVRGAADDLAWVLGRGTPELLADPAAWVFGAALLPTVALVVSTVSSGAEDAVMRMALTGSLLMVVVAVVLWRAGRVR